MLSIRQEDVPALLPAVAIFDEHNSVLAFVEEMSVGALKTDEQLFRDDKAEAYYGAISSLRSREAKPLREALKFCAKLAINEVSKDTPEYEAVRGSLIIDANDEDAIEQADLVLDRFSSKINMKAYEKLYGSLYGTKKKPTRKKIRPKLDLQQTIAEDESIQVEETKAPRSLAGFRFDTSAVGVAKTEIRQIDISDRQQSLNIKRFVDDLSQGVEDFIVAHGGIVQANRLYRHLEELLGDDCSREDSRQAIANLMMTGAVFKQGTQGGMLHITHDSTLVQIMKTSKETPAKKESKNEEDMSRHELIPNILKIIAGSNVHRGVPSRSIALQLDVEEEEVKRVLSYLTNSRAIASEMGRVGKGLSKKKTETKLYRFPSRNDYVAYKASPSSYIEKSNINK